jgi:hypothetical protein
MSENSLGCRSAKCFGARQSRRLSGAVLLTLASREVPNDVGVTRWLSDAATIEPAFRSEHMQINAI